MTSFGLCSSNGRKCFKTTISNSGGGGVGKVRFLGINKLSTLENRYVPGSGVGAKTISMRNALYQRATNNINAGCNTICKKRKFCFPLDKNKVIFYNTKL